MGTTTSHVASRTVLGPLTTTWTQPPSCSIAIAACSTCQTGWLGQLCSKGTIVADNPGCWPPRNGTRVPTPSPLFAWGVYSPGLVCPAGYTTACSATGGGSSQWTVAFSLLPEETAIGCCPSGFACGQGHSGSQTCIAVASTPTTTTFATATCVNGATNQYSFITVPSKGKATYKRYAPMFQLNFQSSDLFPPSTSVSGSVISNTTTSITNGTMTTSLEPSQTSSGDHDADGGGGGGGGLSPGAMAGVGLSAALGGIFIAVVVFLLARHNRRQKAKAALAPSVEIVVIQNSAA